MSNYDDEKDKKSRSPRYPSINLQEAIEKARLIYEKEHIHKAGREVVARDLGYAGINGASATMISSIKQYGLLENVGDRLRISDDATTILELPHTSPERTEAIKKAAFTPKLFADIYEEFGYKLPSDENLRLFLIKMGFNKKAAENAIRAYRETLSIVKEELDEYNEDNNALDVSSKTSINALQEQNARIKSIKHNVKDKNDDLIALKTYVSGNYTEDFQYRIADDCKARILFEGNITQEAIKKLIAYLELGIDDFPLKQDLNK